MSWKTHLLKSTDFFLHVYNRGVDRGLLFFRDTDFEYFLLLMAQALNKGDVSLFAYSLLPNHFHLIARQTTEYAISLYMQRVCWNYTRYINRRRPRTGHLFESRFKLNQILDDASLLRMSHYVHWNAVAAGLAQDLSSWKYCSFTEYAQGLTTGFLAVEQVVSLVGGRERYLQFLRDYDPSEPGSVVRYLKHE